ncbi:MAG: hypothetical protein JXM70_15495 [Pirellulales bacterium]|nr:hypothetical protein [Pirellulales bacterium]
MRLIWFVPGVIIFRYFGANGLVWRLKTFAPGFFELFDELPDKDPAVA